MVKPRIMKKNGERYLQIKAKKGQQIAEREMYLINNDKVSGLVHVGIEKKRDKFNLFYDVAQFIPLSYFLKNTITRQLFAQMLINILENLKSMRTMFIDQKMLLLDLDHVYVTESDYKIFFICVPIHPVVQDNSLRDFLLNIVQYSNFSEKEDLNYLTEYQSIVNKGINFSLFELEEYLLSLTNRKKVIVCPKCQAKMEQKTSFCVSCGYEMAGNMKDTAVINSVYIKNEVLSHGIPFLLRKRYGERIVIQNTPFRIGKSKDCDFCINNNAISRHHVNVIAQDERYFIVDLNSTNKTFVNGNVLLRMTETEIFPGDIITLADEEFVFGVVT